MQCYSIENFSAQIVMYYVAFLDVTYLLAAAATGVVDNIAGIIIVALARIGLLL